MKTVGSALVFGIGVLIVSCGSPARAQLGGLGEAAKKGASDAVKQEVQKGVAEQLGLPTLTPVVTPATAAPGATNTPGAVAEATPASEPMASPAAADTPAAGADKGAAATPAGEVKAAPEAAAPAATRGAAGMVHDTAADLMKQKSDEMKKKIPQVP